MFNSVNNQWILNSTKWTVHITYRIIGNVDKSFV